MSPRKPDLVGLKAIVDLLTDAGKVNQETGEPLNDARVSALTNREDFPKPVYGTRESRNRLWRRSEVVAWAERWDQTAGYPKGRPRVPKRKDG